MRKDSKTRSGLKPQVLDKERKRNLGGGKEILSDEEDDYEKSYPPQKLRFIRK